MAEGKSLEERLAELERKLEVAQREVAQLREENSALKARVRELEARLRRSSFNSSMPPSADPPWIPKRRKDPTGRRAGGQPGHAGKSRPRFEPGDVDAVVEVAPEACRACGRSLKGAAPAGEPVLHQVVEVPATPAAVTEYRLQAVECRCGTTTRAVLPEGVPAGAVGPRLQAVYALLTGRFRLSRREAVELAAAAFGEKARVALGTVVALEARTTAALHGAYAEALEAVRGARVANADETGWRQRGERSWLWNAVAGPLRVFHLDRRRSADAFERFLGKYRGVLGADRWSGYHRHPPTRRQVCWAHLRRNFQEVEDRGGPGAHFGEEGGKAANAVILLWDEVREGKVPWESLARRLRPVRERLRWLLERHVDSEDGKARSLARDLLRREVSLWTFTRRRGVEPTNNAAERAIRKAVLWRKSSFGTASAAGSRFVERMLTVSESLRAQGRSVLDFLEAAVRAQLDNAPHPSLLPARVG
jgi:transposase